MESRNKIFSRNELSLVLLSLVPILYVFLSYFFSPYHYVILVTESGFGEWLTVVTLLVVFYIALKRALRLRREGKPCFFIACFGLGALFLAMEEISWGERILGFDIPAVSKHSEQHEVNIHNIIGNENINMVAGWVVLIYGLVAPLILALSGRLREIFQRMNFPIPTTGAVPIFAVVVVAYLARHHLGKSVEIAELFIALGLLATAIEFESPGEERESGRNRRIARVFAAALVAALAVTQFGGFLGGGATGGHLVGFAEYYYPRSGLTRQSMDALKSASGFVETGHEFPYGLTRSSAYLIKAYFYEELGRKGRVEFCLERAKRLGQLDLLQSMHVLGIALGKTGEEEKSLLVFQQAEEWAETFLNETEDPEELQYMTMKILLSRGKDLEFLKLKKKRPGVYSGIERACMGTLRERYLRDHEWQEQGQGLIE